MRSPLSSNIISWLLFGLAVLAICQGFTLQEPSQMLKKKLDAKLDINPYYLEIIEKRAKNLNLQCSHQDGPYCSLINDSKIVGAYNSTEKSDLLKTYFLRQMRDASKSMNSEQAKQTSQFPHIYYLDRSRSSFDEMVFYGPAEIDVPVKILLDFNQIEAHLAEVKEDQPFSFVYAASITTGQQYLMKEVDQNKFDTLMLSFKDVYIGQYEKQVLIHFCLCVDEFLFRKMNFEVSKRNSQLQDRLEKLHSLPEGIYIQSRQTKGRIQFNIPVILKSMYVRLQPTTQFMRRTSFTLKRFSQSGKLIREEEIDMKEVGSSSSMQLELVSFPLESNQNNNAWAIEFSSNIVIDNILVHIDRRYLPEPPLKGEFEMEKSATPERIAILQSIQQLSSVYSSTSDSESIEDAKETKQVQQRMTKEVRKQKRLERNKLKEEEEKKEIEQERLKVKRLEVELPGAPRDGSVQFDVEKLKRDLEEVEEAIKKLQTPKTTTTTTTTSKKQSSTSTTNSSTKGKQTQSSSDPAILMQQIWKGLDRAYDLKGLFKTKEEQLSFAEDLFYLTEIVTEGKSINPKQIEADIKQIEKQLMKEIASGFPSVVSSEKWKQVQIHKKASINSSLEYSELIKHRFSKLQEQETIAKKTGLKDEFYPLLVMTFSIDYIMVLLEDNIEAIEAANIDTSQFLEMKFETVYKDEVILSRMNSISEAVMNIIVDEYMDRPSEKAIRQFYEMSKIFTKGFEMETVDFDAISETCLGILDTLLKEANSPKFVRKTYFKDVLLEKVVAQTAFFILARSPKMQEQQEKEFLEFIKDYYFDLLIAVEKNKSQKILLQEKADQSAFSLVQELIKAADLILKISEVDPNTLLEEDRLKMVFFTDEKPENDSKSPSNSRQSKSTSSIEEPKSEFRRLISNKDKKSNQKSPESSKKSEIKQDL